MLLLRLFPTIDPIFRFLFHLLRSNVTVLRPLYNNLWPSFLFNGSLIPIHLPNVKGRKRRFHCLFRAYFRYNVSNFRFLRDLIHPLRSNGLFLGPIRILIPNASLLPLNHCNHFRSRSAFRANAPPLNSNFLLLTCLLLWRPSAPIRPNRFRFRLPFLFERQRSIFLRFNSNFVRRSAIKGTISSLFLLLIQ